MSDKIDKELACSTLFSEKISDARLDIIANYTLASFRLKQENWQKMMSNDLYKQTIQNWLNSPQRRTLVITLSSGGMLIAKNDVTDLYTSTQKPPTIHTESAISHAVFASTSTAAPLLVEQMPFPPPSSSFATLDGVPRGKYVYFTRRQPDTILTKDNFESEVVFGDMPLHSKIETMAIVFDDIFKPLLNNFIKNNKCPRILSKDLQERMKDVQKYLTEIKGKTNNRTILSLLLAPQTIEEVMEECNKGNLQPAIEAKFRNVLEEIFINWTQQIHEIINEKTACVVDAQYHHHPQITIDIVGVVLPIHEVNFWINRKHNLQNIYEQLQAQTHKSLAFILERIDSVYHAPFVKVFKQLIMAWHEAQEITIWLPPVLRQTSAFNAVNFPNSLNLIPPLVHVIHLIWCNCRYYSYTRRMTVLLGCICNLLVHRAKEDLELPTLFQGDYEEGLSKISKTIEILDYFKTTLCEYRDKYSQNLLPALERVVDNAMHVNVPTSSTGIQELWRFSNEDVFKNSLDAFTLQLLEIQNIFKAAVSFQNLEKLEIGGWHGKYLSDKMKLIHGEFKVLFEENALNELHFSQQQSQTRQNSEHSNFLKWKQQIFVCHMEVLEKKLATILVQAFLDCPSWEHLLKLCTMFGSMCQQQSILAEMQPVLTHIFNIYNQELLQLEESVREILLTYECEKCVLLPKHNTLPTVVASIICVQQHLKRCDALDANELNTLISKLIETVYDTKADYDNLQSRRNILVTKLINLQMTICNNWNETIEERILRALDANILTQCQNASTHAEGTYKKEEFNSNQMEIQINSCHELFTILKEAKYLVGMASNQTASRDFATVDIDMDAVNIVATNSYGIETDMPSKAAMQLAENMGLSTPLLLMSQRLPAAFYDLYAKRDKLWERKIKLIKISEFYNGIRNGVRSSCELALISSEVYEIDEFIDRACTTMTWQSYDDDFIEKLYVSTRQLNERLKQSHQNLETIFNNMRRWSREPLHQRSPYGRNLLDLTNQRERLRIRLQCCGETRTLVNRLLIANFCLFFKYNESNFDIYSRDLTVEEFLQQFPDEQSRTYKKYLKLVDGLLQNELRRSIKISLTYLHKEISKSSKIPMVLETNDINGVPQTPDHNNDGSYSTSSIKGNYNITTDAMPLFEVQLELMATTEEICFTPAFDLSVENNFQQIVEQLLQDISQMSDSMPSIVHDNALSDNEGDDSAYEGANKTNLLLSSLLDEQAAARQLRLQGECEILSLKSSIQQAVNDTIIAGLAYAKKFNAYNYLWKLRKLDVFNDSIKIAKEESLTIGPGYAIMNCFKKEIDRFNELHDEIYHMNGRHTINGWLVIDINPLKYALLNQTCKWTSLFKSWLLQYVKKTHKELSQFIKLGLDVLQMNVARTNFQSLLRLLSVMSQIKQNESYVDNIFKPLRDITALLKTYNVHVEANITQVNDQLPLQWKQLRDLSLSKAQSLHHTILYQQQRITALINIFECHVKHFANDFVKIEFFRVPCENVYELCDSAVCRLESFTTLYKRLSRYACLLNIGQPDDAALQHCGLEVKRIKQLWDFVRVIESCVYDWHATPWQSIDTDDVENECKKITRELRNLDKNIRLWAPYVHIVNVLKDLMSSLRPITDLQNSAITERHWLELMTTTKLTRIHKIEYLVSFKSNAETTLENLLKLGIHTHEDDIKNTLDCALKEMTVTKILDEINTTWSNMSFDLEPHSQRQGLKLLKVSEQLIETLDDNQLQLQNISSSKHIDYLLSKLTHWQNVLTSIDTLIENWFEVQRKWIYLESIFIGSPDIREQLPQEALRFETIDEQFTQLLQQLGTVRVVMMVVLQHEYVFEILKELQKRLTICEKALNDYLETKRLTFPRFYFISAADLLDILSNGNKPLVIKRHLVKLFDSILRLEYQANTQLAIGMHSKENDEYVAFTSRASGNVAVECSGRVELWLNAIVQQMRQTLRTLFQRALNVVTEQTREQWLLDWPAQVALCCSQISWTSDVNRAFAWLEDGYEAAMKDLHKRQITQLNALINLLLGELTPGDRQKIMTICTIDVHSRDVVGKIVLAKLDNSTAFQWQSQLRHRWDESIADNNTQSDDNQDEVNEDCFANICDAEFIYAYEYLGNTSRLVITPLTDRCYITLSQSLHLNMGGAPAGPAGTGKTETTKDLGRALGMMVYVFNCSEQMDYKSCGNIYKGLAQTGAWGCFDEFNRISVEVLSVIAVQVKTIQEAIKAQANQFLFMNEIISLVPSVGIFITMNPGYAGRTELPENLKTLFRPCAMIVPDFALICEIMLVAEGFQDARLLARKFITLYTLCKELLSKQDHYDWGLRAIKSVLIVAGSLKRDDRTRPEDQILMRALRDFNMPKIVTEDVSIFVGLIGDLFPALDVPRKRLYEFEKIIRRAINELKLQPEDNFLIKVVQLQELLDVRHSVFIVGNAGTGKTRIWQTLRETYRIQKRKPVVNVLNPKALTNDELFGIVNQTTREWKDGLFSSIMREQANMSPGNPKWIVLDGDIDPMWIESLNTLMDDNKILTLASNERIPLTKDMRLLFEVGNLSAATPATVSRAGVLYINPQDLGWSPYILSWLETRQDIIERGILTKLFEKYFPTVILKQKEFRRIVPITDISMIQMTCYLLECMINNIRGQQLEVVQNSEDVHSLHQNVFVSDGIDLTLEIIFVYCTMNAFGAGLFKDHIIDWYREFHKWWISDFKDIKLPAQGTIFDYYLNLKTTKFQRWSELLDIEKIDVFNNEGPIQNILIHTAETMRLTYFLKLLTDINLPCLLVGPAGSGKSAIFRELFKIYISSQELLEIADNTVYNKTSQMKSRHNQKKPLLLAVQSTFFNFYSSSEHFQKIIDFPLEKKAGRCYAPQGANRHLIYFINDLNMPEVDAFGTVGPHTIMRQFMDYRQWYDRQRLQVKDIRHCQFAAVMNPTAGSFTIDPRLQRHFCVFALSAPIEETMQYIYTSILSAHLENPNNYFCKEIRSLGKLLVQVGITLHKRAEACFLPTALKFHYIFNLRDLTAIYQGLMNTMGSLSNANATLSTGVICNKPADLMRLYVHEAFRIYHDRLVDMHDIKSFRTSIKDIFKKDFEDFDEDYVFTEPLIYSHFAQSLVDQKYMPLKSWKHLQTLLMEAQSNYNDAIGYINLVLFEDAMVHVCRINRILESPRGNALLIGVGGSGKQTLARLASFISSLAVFQIQLKRGFCLQDLKDEIGSLFMRVAIKNIASVFLISDAQIANESHLMLVNDLLSSGEIPELFSDDQVESIINGIRNEVKQNGTIDTKENCWRFFIEKIRKNLKVVLCFSPVGQTLRIRCRKFPALIKRTTIDWFHEWPKSALESVSQKFLTDIEYILPKRLVTPISGFMAYVHASVNQISKVYLQNEKRYNYTTPKTFLEYIYLYCKLLKDKHNEYIYRIQRLQGGMAKLAECANQVDTLKNQLAVQEVQLAAKNIAADKLITIVSAESEKIKKEKYISSEEEKRVRIIEEDVSIKTKLCEDDLHKAEPALIAAQAALNTLNKNNLTELKSFGSPPKAVVSVCAAVMVLLAKNGKIPRDRSWKAAKLMMVRVDQFLNDLLNYDKDNIHSNIIEALQNYLKDPEFNPDKIVQKSVAAAGLCAWVINIHRYHQVFLIVGPKQKALQDSQKELLDARQSLDYLKVKITTLETQLSELQKEFEEAVLAKRKCQAEADKTAFTIDLAHRLINGLSNENIRWKESVQSLQLKIGTLPGDILLVSSFLSYAGSFSKRYREELQEYMWMPNFLTLQPAIPYTENADPLMLFSDEAQIATWNNEGLPMDKMSTENATILAHSTRWPLMIDPQLQGIKWIKNRFNNTLVVIRVTQKGFMDVLEKSIAKGETVLLEQIGESVDTVLDPLLSRALIKKGRYIRIGDKEIDFNNNFRLILHTKLANPHYKPEMQAQTTLINFTVTPDGLEEQLLAEVVKIERPDLEQMKMNVTVQQNKFKISLKALEDELLARLTSASENVLDDQALVINLEATKSTVIDIELKVIEARNTTIQIDNARNIYRAAARRAAILYFVLTDLIRINPLYKFSLKSFMNVFKHAIAQAPPCQNYERRVVQLVDTITQHTFCYIQRGLFQRDKLTFATHMVLRIMIAAEQISKEEVDFILRYPHDPNTLSPFDFIGRQAWGGIKTLSLMEHFYGIDKDIENYPKRWKKFLDSNAPEIEPFPGEWKHRTALQKLCIIRALRPDRMTYAITLFIEQTLGTAFTRIENSTLAEMLAETSTTTPIFFILSPGVDPVRDVEALALRKDFTTQENAIINISLGQGQEILAEQAILKAISSDNHWVILQNVHLVVNWLPELEKLIERITNGGEVNAKSAFRLFITAEPAPDPQYHVIPQGILESSLKIVNEPPAGLAANMHKSWDNFSQETLEACTQEAEFKSILFTLCYFHAVVGERRKFGTQGWNKIYPFNVGDLNISMNVLHNYLEGSTRIPWEDLRYLFGEIMYGGHITDDWDRRLCRTYLEELLRQELIDGDFELCPSFYAPPNLDYMGYHRYIKEMLPPESPELYGLHANAEIGFLTITSQELLKTVFELQPRESELSTNCIAPREELVRIMADDFLDKLQDEFNIKALLNRVERKSPFVVVSLQECERMNILIREIKRSLRELVLGLKGELTMTQEMECLDNAIFYDHVPETWTHFAYPSVLGLQAWFANLLHRIKELTGWINDFKLPCSIWLGGLFNPQSFLTAIMQESARRHDLPLDRMRLNSDVTKKDKDDVNLPPTEGAFIHGLYLEGASWDLQLNSIVCLQPKQLMFSMPVLYIKAVVQEKQELQKIYECPLYKTRLRGDTYVWTFNLKTRTPPAKWILGGVALLLQI